MNILGFSSPEMVNFLRPEDFLFGTRGWYEGNEQGGIYNRYARLPEEYCPSTRPNHHRSNFVSLRIERVPSQQLRRLHSFFLDLHLKWTKGEVHYVFGTDGYGIAYRPSVNPLLKLIVNDRCSKLRNLTKGRFECGNCSDWIGYALQQVGLLDKRSTLPVRKDSIFLTS